MLVEGGLFVMLVEVGDRAVDITDKLQPTAELAGAENIVLGGIELAVVVQPDLLVLSQEVVGVEQFEGV